jgi:hypothetical protein
MFHIKFTEKIKINILFSTIFFFENRAICEIIWKNIVESDRPEMTIWRMRIVCWIPKATNKHTHIPLQQCLHE